MRVFRRNVGYVMTVVAALAFAIVWPETVAASGIAFDATGASGTYSGSGANTWTHVNAGNILFVGCWSRTTDGVSAATYNGVAMTLGVKNVAGGFYAYIYYILNPASGSHTVSITSTAELSCASASYTGASQTAQPDNTASATNPAWDPPTVTMTVNTANSWAFGVTTNGGFGSNAGTGTNLTRLQQLPSTVGAIYDSHGALATGSTVFTPVVIGGTPSQTIAVMSFKPLAAYQQKAHALGFGH